MANELRNHSDKIWIMLAKWTLLLDLAINKKIPFKSKWICQQHLQRLRISMLNCTLRFVISYSIVRVPMKEISRTKKYKKVRKNIVGLVFHRHVVGPIWNQAGKSASCTGFLAIFPHPIRIVIITITPFQPFVTGKIRGMRILANVI